MNYGRNAKESKKIQCRKGFESNNAHCTPDTITGLYERFCNYKQTEGLSQRTIKDYKSHLHYLMKFLEDKDINRNEMTRDLFSEYISWMLYEQGLSPVTVNVRIRTLRVFLRFCFKEGYIQNPIHEDLKILKPHRI